MRSVFSLICVACLAMTGCSQPAGPEMISISGTVSFEGSPVEAGHINFFDQSSGMGGQGQLSPGGKYQAEVPAGTYDVSVTPNMVMVDSGPNSPPSEEYEKVNNIPVRYHVGASSGLTATVSSDKTTHDFNMTQK